MTSKTFFEHVSSHLVPVYEKKEARSITHILLQYIFRLSRNQIIINEREFTNTDVQKVEPYIKRLIQHEPIQYILEQAHFYGEDFYVNSEVLIPRPETEELVHLIIEQHDTTHLKMLDIGTGSGCIPITLARHLPCAEVHALDVSTKALAVAQKNSKKLNALVAFHHIDILKNDLSALPNFDVIISNPPYVQKSEQKHMKCNVLQYEPELALFVPNDSPLIFYERILDLSLKKLKNKGHIYFEINEVFGEEVKQLLQKYDFENINIHKDLQNKDRLVSATR